MTMLIWFGAGFGSAVVVHLLFRCWAAYKIRDITIATFEDDLDHDFGSQLSVHIQPKAAKAISVPPPKPAAQPDPQSVSELSRQLKVREAMIEDQTALIDQLDPLMGEVRELRDENAELKRVLNTCRQTHDLCTQAFQRMDKERSGSDAVTP